MDAAAPALAERLPPGSIRLARAGPPSLHALGGAAVALALLLLAALLPLDAPPLSLFSCPLRAATGVPCLSCGATHAFSYLSRGQLGAALWSNPLAAVLGLLLFVHLALTLLRLGGLRWTLAFEPPGPGALRRLRALALGALLCNWAFVALLSGGGARWP